MGSLGVAAAGAAEGDQPTAGAVPPPTPARASPACRPRSTPAAPHPAALPVTYAGHTVFSSSLLPSAAALESSHSRPSDSSKARGHLAHLRGGGRRELEEKRQAHARLVTPVASVPVSRRRPRPRHRRPDLPPLLPLRRRCSSAATGGFFGGETKSSEWNDWHADENAMAPPRDRPRARARRTWTSPLKFLTWSSAPSISRCGSKGWSLPVLGLSVCGRSGLCAGQQIALGSKSPCSTRKGDRSSWALFAADRASYSNPIGE